MSDLQDYVGHRSSVGRVALARRPDLRVPLALPVLRGRPADDIRSPGFCRASVISHPGAGMDQPPGTPEERLNLSSRLRDLRGEIHLRPRLQRTPGWQERP